MHGNEVVIKITIAKTIGEYYFVTAGNFLSKIIHSFNAISDRLQQIICNSIKSMKYNNINAMNAIVIILIK